MVRHVIPTVHQARKCRVRNSSASLAPSAVSTTDFALPFGSQIHPRVVQLVEKVPFHTLPRSDTLMVAEGRQAENRQCGFHLT